MFNRAFIQVLVVYVAINAYRMYVWKHSYINVNCMCIYICLSREKPHINVYLQISLIMYVLISSMLNP